MHQKYLKIKSKTYMPDPDNMTKQLPSVSEAEGFTITCSNGVYRYQREGSHNFVETTNVEYAWGVEINLVQRDAVVVDGSSKKKGGK